MSNSGIPAKQGDSLFGDRTARPFPSRGECRVYARRVLRDKADRFDEARQYETAMMLRYAADDLEVADEVERRRAPSGSGVLYDQWGLRIVACDKTDPHGFHGWVSANNDVRCPGVRDRG